MHVVLRTGLSILLGLALALPILGGGALLAHAQAGSGSGSATDTLTADDILSSDFGSATGLGQQDLKTTIAQLIRVVLGFLGVVAIVIVLMGGFKWMTAGGNDQQVEEAKKYLIYGVIGLAIILSGYAITSFVVSSLVTATT